MRTGAAGSWGGAEQAAVGRGGAALSSELNREQQHAATTGRPD